MWRIKLLAFFFAAAIVISSGIFSQEIIDYIGTISSSKRIDISITDIVITPSGDEFKITLIYVIINPTSYSRIKFHYLYYQLFLNINGVEKLIGGVTHFTHEPLIPHKEYSYESTLHVSKAKNQSFSTFSSKSELIWRIRYVIQLETPIKKYYQTMDIYTTSLGPRMST